MTKKNCFIISRIGKTESITRQEADEVYDKLITIALGQLYQLNRSDKSTTPGTIPSDIVDRVINSDLVIADITPDTIVNNGIEDFKWNANVFYEVALRHSLNLPIILICKDTIVDKGSLPFDISSARVITYNIGSYSDSIKKLKKMEKEIFKTELVYYCDFSEKIYKNYGISFGKLLNGHSSHLISWELSQALEIQAKNVMAITHNLNWARYNIDNLIHDVLNNPDGNGNKHCYIFVSPHSPNTNKAYIDKQIKNAGVSHYFEIRCITQARYNEIYANAGSNYLLPLHSDIVIYEKTKHQFITSGLEQNFLVISTSSVPFKPTMHNVRTMYDVIIKEVEQCNIVLDWFKFIWREIGNDMINNNLTTNIDL